MTIVRCPTCHRVERWQGDAASPHREVVLEGGGRRPASHPALAAWGVLRRSRGGDLGPVVGACAACGQPIVVAEGTWPALGEWRLETPDGVVVVAAAITGPTGPLTEDEAEEWLQSRLRERWTAGYVANQAIVSAMLMTIVVPLALWVLGAIYAGMFIYMGLSTM